MSSPATPQPLVLSSAPNSRVLAMEAKRSACDAVSGKARVLEFSEQFSPRGDARASTMPRASKGRSRRKPHQDSKDNEIDEVFRTLDEISSGALLAPATSSPGITVQDIREHERKSSQPSYAPAAAKALRECLMTRPNDSEDPKNVNALCRVRTPSLRLPAPSSPSSDSEHGGGFDTARTGTTLSDCLTEISQMTTPRAGQPGSGNSAKQHQKETGPNTVTANRLFKAAEIQLDQIDEDTDAELEMFREQQEMIARMCRLKADAFLAKEKEKEEEKKRQLEQLELMRIEQLQLIRLQERARKRQEFQARASSRPVSAPVRRADTRPVAMKTACDDLDASFVTETLSPGVAQRAAEVHNEAFKSPARKEHVPRSVSGEPASQGEGEARGCRVKPRPKSAFNRLMSSLGTKRWRSSILPLPKGFATPTTSRRGSGSSSKQAEAWAAEGIPVMRCPSTDSEDAASG